MVGEDGALYQVTLDLVVSWACADVVKTDKFDKGKGIKHTVLD
jgi:hypothetical protein